MYLLYMVAVFKTNIPGKKEFAKIIHILQQGCPRCSISFDDEDCDKIVRIEGENRNLYRLSELITHEGYSCEILE